MLPAGFEPALDDLESSAWPLGNGSIWNFWSGAIQFVLFGSTMAHPDPLFPVLPLPHVYLSIRLSIHLYPDVVKARGRVVLIDWASTLTCRLIAALRTSVLCVVWNAHLPSLRRVHLIKVPTLEDVPLFLESRPRAEGAVPHVMIWLLKDEEVNALPLQQLGGI